MLLDKKWLIFQSVIVILLISFVSSQQWGGKKKEGCVKTNLKNGKIKPRSNGRVVKYSCNRDYILVGESTSTCLQGEWTSETPVCVAKGCPPLPPPPSGRLASSIGGAVQRVECNPGYYLSGSPMLFCDKYDWNGTVPLCRANGILPSLNCNMESEDLCGWIQDSTDDFDWTLNNYGTPSSHLGTGPSFDHTLGAGKGGHYLFMESSSPRLLNDTARLYSPVYSPPELPMDPTGVGKNVSCFTFWYHMYGSTTGRLHVYIKMESSRLSSVLPAFVRSGDQGNQWRQGYVPIPGNLTENFQMVIEGVRGSGYVGDTAIDDVWLGSGIECQNAKDRMDAESKGSLSGNSTARGSTVTTSTMAPPASSASCFSRCSSPPDASASCGCLDDCRVNGSCCTDYATYCLADDVQGDEQPSFPSRVYDDSDTKSKGRIVMVGAITGGAVGAVLLLASIIVVVLRVRRNKIARIVNHQQDRLAEDSDVRYLKDEDDIQLDLTEATPSSISSSSRRFTDFQQL